MRSFTLSGAVALAFLLTHDPSARAGSVVVSSGYYDLSPAASGGGPALPNPWINSPKTTFYGSAADLSNAVASDPDISGLLVQNFLSTPVTLSAFSLSPSGLDVLARARTPSGNLPPGNVTLLPGQNYIFAVGDGSDEGLTNQTVSITLNDRTFAFGDATSKLAPNGVLAGDMPQLGGGDETQPWTRDASLLSTTVPEPTGLTFAGICLGGLALRAWRRRFAA